MQRLIPPDPGCSKVVFCNANNGHCWKNGGEDVAGALATELGLSVEEMLDGRKFPLGTTHVSAEVRQICVGHCNERACARVFTNHGKVRMEPVVQITAGKLKDTVAKLLEGS